MWRSLCMRLVWGKCFVVVLTREWKWKEQNKEEGLGFNCGQISRSLFPGSKVNYGSWATSAVKEMLVYLETVYCVLCVGDVSLNHIGCKQ